MTPSTLSPAAEVVTYVARHIDKQAQLAMPPAHWSIYRISKMSFSRCRSFAPPTDKYLGIKLFFKTRKSSSPSCSPECRHGRTGKLCWAISFIQLERLSSRKSPRHGEFQNGFRLRMTKKFHNIPTFHKTTYIIHPLVPLSNSHAHSPFFFFPPAPPLPLIKSTRLSPSCSSSPLSIRSASHPRPNFSLKALNLPASSSSMLSSR